jgi:RNA polymerase sigma-70 factor (ECF subfamily)
VSLDEVGYDAEVVVGQLTVSQDASPLAGAEAEEKSAAILQAVGKLPDEQREAFLLQIEGEFDVEEIAAITGCSFETAKSRLRYARSKLRELLKEYA